MRIKKKAVALRVVVRDAADDFAVRELHGELAALTEREALASAELQARSAELEELDRRVRESAETLRSLPQDRRRRS